MPMDHEPSDDKITQERAKLQEEMRKVHVREHHRNYPKKEEETEEEEEPEEVCNE